MSFLKFLQGIGDRLGILESVPAAGPVKAGRIETRSVSLRELTCEIEAGAVRSLAAAPAELAVPFEKIYEAAGIASGADAWSVRRLKRVLEGEAIQGRPRDEVQRTVLAMLQSEGASAESIVRDAMARDSALDAYEAAARGKMQMRMETCGKKIREVEERIRDLEEERKALERALGEDEARWREWQRHKRATERELADVVGYVVDHGVITLDADET